MRVIHVVPAISEEAAGPSYSVPRLCDSLERAGLDIRLATLDWPPCDVNLPYQQVFPVSRWVRRLGISRPMRQWLAQQVNEARVDIIHNHSLWMMPNVYPGQVTSSSRTQLVVSPRGTLSQYVLNRSRITKQLFWFLTQRAALRNTACFHATAESEYADIRESGFNQPICILHNGIDVPPLVNKASASERRVLFLGRIHPIKGLDNLLQAWKAIEGRHPDWRLDIAGPDNAGYLAEMQQLAKMLNLSQVNFLGALYGADKLNAYRQADLFVLPTHSENFGMSVAEALAAGTPVIVSKGAPWSELEQRGCGWWIDIGRDSLVTCLEQALQMDPTQLAMMGQRGRDWMQRDYSWDQIGSQLSEVYRWLKEGGTSPACVRLD